MINQLEGHITQEQVSRIVDIIRNRYEEYKKFVNTEEFQRMFLKEYSSHKSGFSVSWAIDSAFPDNTTVADDLNVENFKYSNSFHRPLLSNANIKIFIFNNITQAQYLKNFLLF